MSERGKRRISLATVDHWLLASSVLLPVVAANPAINLTAMASGHQQSHSTNTRSLLAIG
jgi:hypothetical protein